MTRTQNATAEINLAPAAPPPTTAERFGDNPLIFHPLDTRVIETTHGQRAATIAEVWEVSDGKLIAHGEQPIFWGGVQRQLAGALRNGGYVTGRLTRNGVAYQLDPPSEQELADMTPLLAEIA